MLLQELDVGQHMMIAWWAVFPDEELVVGRYPTSRL